MKKQIPVILILSLVLALAAPLAAPAQQAQPQQQTVCPVRGNKIDRSAYVDYKGKRIYFCCKGCDADFKKDPEKYMKQMEEKGVYLEPTPQEGAGKK